MNIYKNHKNIKNYLNIYLQHVSNYLRFVKDFLHQYWNGARLSTETECTNVAWKEGKNVSVRILGNE